MDKSKRQNHRTYGSKEKFNHRQHIATKLLEHILPMAGNEVSLLVLKSNLPAINLYRKLGFTIAEEFKGKYNESIAVTVLRLSKTQAAF